VSVSTARWALKLIRDIRGRGEASSSSSSDSIVRLFTRALTVDPDRDGGLDRETDDLSSSESDINTLRDLRFVPLFSTVSA